MKYEVIPINTQAQPKKANLNFLGIIQIYFIAHTESPTANDGGTESVLLTTWIEKSK